MKTDNTNPETQLTDGVKALIIKTTRAEADKFLQGLHSADSRVYFLPADSGRDYKNRDSVVSALNELFPVEFWDTMELDFDKVVKYLTDYHTSKDSPQLDVTEKGKTATNDSTPRE